MNATDHAPTPDGQAVRLQKVLAGAGLGSRRACEELIDRGRVSVDGQIVREQGRRIDPRTAVVHVDGKRIQLDSSLLTVALNKPAGVVTTMSDPHGRPTVAELVAPALLAGRQRLYHVGRLDTDTSGLLLLTNDGELSHRLTHPSFEIPKTYIASVRGAVGKRVVRELLEGIELDDGPIAADRVTVRAVHAGRSTVQVVLHSGRNRIVRRMFEAVGHPVVELARTRIGPVRLGTTKPGHYRVLEGSELGELMAAVGM